MTWAQGDLALFRLAADQKGSPGQKRAVEAIRAPYPHATLAEHHLDYHYYYYYCYYYYLFPVSAI